MTNPFLILLFYYRLLSISSVWSIRLNNIALGTAPVDSTDIYELLLDDAYVDKTLLIERLVNHCGTVCRITRPSGWGKTTALKTALRFFQLELNETDGTLLPVNERINRILFTGGRLKIKQSKSVSMKTLDGLKIGTTEIVRELGKYPVIYIDLDNVVGSTLSETERNVVRLISDLYRRRAYLKTEPNRILFDTYANAYYDERDGDHDDNNKKKKPLSHAKLRDSLRMLTEMLSRHHDESVYVLIDNYDAPARDSFIAAVRETKLNSNNKNNHLSDSEIFARAVKLPLYHKTISLIANILGPCLKDNSYLEQAFLTGIYDIPVKNMYDGLEYDVKYNVLDEDFSTFYGFTEVEIERLSLLADNRNRTFRETVRRWYGGYDYFASKRNSSLYYNPRSIKRFLANDKRFENYLNEDDPFTGYVLGTDEIQEIVQRLSSGDSYRCDYTDSVIRFEETIDKLHEILLFAGYTNGFSSVDAISNMTVPNLEIDDEFRRIIFNWTLDKLSNVDGNNNNNNNSHKTNVLKKFRSLAGSLDDLKNDTFVEQLQTLSSSVSGLRTTDDDDMNDYEPDILCNGIVISLSYLLETAYGYNRRMITGTDDETAFAKPVLLIPNESSGRDAAITIGYKIENTDEREINRETIIELDVVKKLLRPYERFVRRLTKILLILNDKGLSVKSEIRLI